MAGRTTGSTKIGLLGQRRESGLDRLDSVLFVLMILSRTAPSARLRASSTRYGAAAFGGYILDKIINTNK
jgi:hypothetical protein